MGLSVGIIGLPNVGKSTVFNALTGTQNAEVANYPFCTIKPNHAVVPVPDERVEKLAELVDVPDSIHATIEFFDIAGLVAGASKGEGLGNRFLANIRDTAAVVHVVRCFDDPNVVHISDQLNPVQDIEIVNLELVLSDLEQLDRKIERLSNQAKADKSIRPLLEFAINLRDHFAAGKAARSSSNRLKEEFVNLNKELRFLTAKPVIYAANVDEAGLGEVPECVKTLERISLSEGAEMVVFCAKLEEEMVNMTLDERREFLELAGADESGLQQVIRKSFEALNLISFFTKNEKEVRAWTVKRGTSAPQAAGQIHTDFERGFIKADVVSFKRFLEFGSDSALKSAGLMRQEGKDYIVQDGDIIYFRFNI
jgi:GTP-binding protein YchF